MIAFIFIQRVSIDETKLLQRLMQNFLCKLSLVMSQDSKRSFRSFNKLFFTLLSIHYINFDSSFFAKTFVGHSLVDKR